ncbi:sensor histidine kinase [Streptacidiphilus sp. PB12-B1b]|uniref:sensor histidine kinase n=1 Tax=Streptacidiphilus sp. PB12-B1b TaxID=2705012 RepID=UPI0015F798E4|nr:histidine kinase [Streptacidiphilus sp. PB12-B1b]QMU80563.1 sensor histidine kinase [Streptacidiphilus sp. PB12-B1b]
MEQDAWTSWPSQEALERRGMTPARRAFGLLGRYFALTVAVWLTFVGTGLRGGHAWIVVGTTAAGSLAFAGFLRSSTRKRVLPCLLWLALVLAASLVALHFGGQAVAILLLCGIAMGSMQRLPPVVGMPVTAISAVLYILLVPASGWLGDLGPVLGLGALGYVGRLDWESRAGTFRLLAQERAARAAEAESAALAERARIAREIHDVLAHSLSAQLVHLEAARLMLDAGADREQLRERIVSARRMAQDGLAETRAALSALRGEFVPVSEFLASLAGNDGATLAVEGSVRPLPAEVGVAVRRTAQEALTNVRKHAPDSACAVRLSYLDGTVELEVRNGPSPHAGGELAASGSGYGLLGMRERAELLGGSLLAGPEEGGFRVLLSVPTP